MVDMAHADHVDHDLSHLDDFLELEDFFSILDDSRLAAAAPAGEVGGSTGAALQAGHAHAGASLPGHAMPGLQYTHQHHHHLQHQPHPLQLPTQLQQQQQQQQPAYSHLNLLRTGSGVVGSGGSEGGGSGEYASLAAAAGLYNYATAASPEPPDASSLWTDAGQHAMFVPTGQPQSALGGYGGGLPLMLVPPAPVSSLTAAEIDELIEAASRSTTAAQAGMAAAHAAVAAAAQAQAQQHIVATAAAQAAYAAAMGQPLATGGSGAGARLLPQGPAATEAPSEPEANKRRRGADNRSRGGGGGGGGSGGGQRSTSRYRGVTHHCRTGRYEAHIWEDGKQVYLGGFQTEEQAALAYDICAVKCRGAEAMTNFCLSNYESELRRIAEVSKEELILSLRRQSKGQVRGTSRYRGVTRHQKGRWESRIGQLIGKKYKYLGLFDTEEEAAQAYDHEALAQKGIEAALNFPIETYAHLLPAEQRAALQAALRAEEAGASGGAAGPVVQRAAVAAAADELMPAAAPAAAGAAAAPAGGTGDAPGPVAAFSSTSGMSAKTEDGSGGFLLNRASAIMEEPSVEAAAAVSAIFEASKRALDDAHAHAPELGRQGLPRTPARRVLARDGVAEADTAITIEMSVALDPFEGASAADAFDTGEAYATLGLKESDAALAHLAFSVADESGTGDAGGGSSDVHVGGASESAAAGAAREDDARKRARGADPLFMLMSPLASMLTGEHPVNQLRMQLQAVTAAATVAAMASPGPAPVALPSATCTAAPGPAPSIDLRPGRLHHWGDPIALAAPVARRISAPARIS